MVNGDHYPAARVAVLVIRQPDQVSWRLKAVPVEFDMVCVKVEFLGHGERCLPFRCCFSELTMLRVGLPKGGVRWRGITGAFCFRYGAGRFWLSVDSQLLIEISVCS